MKVIDTLKENLIQCPQFKTGPTLVFQIADQVQIPTERKRKMGGSIKGTAKKGKKKAAPKKAAKKKAAKKK